MAFRFVICSVLSSVPLGELELSDVTWNDPTYGSGASFSGMAEINAIQDRDKLSSLTEPDSVALYVLDDSTGRFLFGGPIFDRTWNRETRLLEIKAQSWKAWTYQKLFGYDRTTNPASDIPFSRTNIDQFDIARDIFYWAIDGYYGCPVIVRGSETSGVLRDLNLHASDFKYVGDIIDSMANRYDGFEWSIDIVPNAKRQPTLRLGLYYPGKGNLNNQVLIVHQRTDGGNILELSAPQDTTSERRSRVWATGAGQPPDLPVAYDQDPAFGPNSSFLLRESVRNYNGVTQIKTLAAHARSERNYRNQSLQSVVVGVGLDDPDYTTYASGDKIRLLVEDDWIAWDFKSVRIVDRTFSINDSSDSPKPDMARMLIDLNDMELPENTTVL